MPLDNANQPTEPSLSEAGQGFAVRAGSQAEDAEQRFGDLRSQFVTSSLIATGAISMGASDAFSILYRQYFLLN